MRHTYIYLSLLLLLATTGYSSNTNPKDSLNLDKDRLDWPNCPSIKYVDVYKISELGEYALFWNDYDNDRIEYEIEVLDKNGTTISSAQLTSPTHYLQSETEFNVAIRSKCYSDNSIEPIETEWYNHQINPKAITNTLCDAFSKFITVDNDVISIRHLPYGLNLNINLWDGNLNTEIELNSEYFAEDTDNIFFKSIILKTKLTDLICNDWGFSKLQVNPNSLNVTTNPQREIRQVQITPALSEGCNEIMNIAIQESNELSVAYPLQTLLLPLDSEYDQYSIEVYSTSSNCSQEYSISLPNSVCSYKWCGGNLDEIFAAIFPMPSGSYNFPYCNSQPYCSQYGYSYNISQFLPDLNTALLPYGGIAYFENDPTLACKGFLIIENTSFYFSYLTMRDVFSGEENISYFEQFNCSGPVGPPLPPPCCTVPPPPQCCKDPSNPIYPSCGDVQIYMANAASKGDSCAVTIYSENYPLFATMEVTLNGQKETFQGDRIFAVLPSGSDIKLRTSLYYEDANGQLDSISCVMDLVLDCTNTPVLEENPSLCDQVNVYYDDECNLTYETDLSGIEVAFETDFPQSDSVGPAPTNNSKREEGTITYHIQHITEFGQISIAECSMEKENCVVPPEIGDENLCDYLFLELDSTNYLPFYQLSWEIHHMEQKSVEYTINGGSSNLSSEQSGFVSITPGDNVAFTVELELGSKTEICTQTFSTQEVTPNEEIDNDICAYFSLVESEISTDEAMTMTIAGGDENLILTEIGRKGMTMADLEDFLSQIQSLQLILDYSNQVYPRGNTENIELYSSPASSYSGSESLYWHPIDWTEEIVGVSTIGLDGTYQIQIEDFEGNLINCGPFDLPIGELPEDETNFGLLNCGDEVDQSISTQELYRGDLIGQTITINGFPVIISSLNSGTGQGVAALPFGSSEVVVDLTNLSVNTELQAITGSVTVTSGIPVSLPNNSVPLNIGGDICIPNPPPSGTNANGANTVTGLDNYGFDPETGNHSVTNYPFDTNGFDADGNYVLGEPPFDEDGNPNLRDPSEYSQYNPNGCNRDGYSEDGSECDPGGDDTELLAFIDDNEESHKFKMDSLLKVIEATLTDSITNKLNCQQYRSALEDLIKELGYSRTYIVGENDEYIKAGLSEEFESEPKEFDPDLDRNEKTVELETNHIELYKCDKAEITINEALFKISEICAAPEQSNLYDYLVSQMMAWGSAMKENYMNNPEAFNAWMLDQIINYLSENTRLNGLAYQEVEDPTIRIIKDLESIFKFDGFMMESAVASSEPLLLPPGNLRDEMQFQFAQGFKKVMGIDRAFYLREMARTRSANQNLNPILLPIELKTQVGSYEYAIYLDNISWSATSAPTLDAYFIMEDPNSGKAFSMSGYSIPFGPGGLGGGPESRLMLNSDVELRLNNAAMLILNGTDSTYVSWDCNGFSSMGLDLGIEFCRDFIVPLDANHVPLTDPDERYRLNMTTNVSEWIEFDITLDSPGPFSMADYDDIVFDFSNITVDMNRHNGGNITPVSGYQSEYLDTNSNTLTPEWKGFYIESLEVHLPPKLAKGGATQIMIEANNLIIDGSGVTAHASITDEIILDESEGDIGGWPLGINRLGVTVINNHPEAFEFGGRLNVPVFDEFLEYDAFLYPGERYEFTISPLNSVTMDMLLADVTLDNNSSISVSYDNSEFIALANLSGTAKLNGGDKPIVNFPELDFSGFEVSNQSPYFSPGQWSMTDSLNVGFSGFSLSLSDLKMFKPGSIDTEAGLGINIGLKLSDSVDGLDISGGLGIIGKLDITNGRQKWIYDRIEVNELCLAGSFPGVERIDACLNWFDRDPNFGTGFRGQAEIEFKGISANLSAVAQFGNMNDEYKYFFVDALGSFSPGIQAGPISLSGFGGGISHHMTSAFDPENLDFDNPATISNGLGESLSGTIFTPNISKGVGLRAATTFTLANSESMFNGTLEFGMQFNSDDSDEGGGLSNMYLKGIGKSFSNPIPNLGILNRLPASLQDSVHINQDPEVDAALAGFVYFNYDFNTPSFNGDIGIFLDTPLLKGNMAGNPGKLADGKIFFNPTEWGIEFGTPTVPAKATLDLGSVGSADLCAYFVTGSSIPSIPEPSPKIQSLLGNAYRPLQNLNFGGGGVVFGANFNTTVVVGVEGIIEASLYAEAGFDVMIKKFDGITCGGSAVGINGWYAAGQAYVGLEGNAKIAGFEVANLGIAALLQARLPNPTVLSGTVGVSARLLFFSVSASFNVTIGDDCEFEQDADYEPGIGMDVIAYYDPYNHAEEMELNQVVNVHLNAEINQSFEALDALGDEHTFRVELVGIEATDKQNRALLIEYDEDETTNLIKIKPTILYPADDTLTFSTTVEVFMNGESLGTETKEVTYYTGPKWNTLRQENIIASYPYDGMYNYYRDESNNNYIQLDIGQPDILDETFIPEDMEQKLVLTSESGVKTFLDYEYNYLENRMTFDLDESTLDLGKLYKLELIRSTDLEAATTEANTNAVSIAGLGGGNNSSISSTQPVSTDRYMTIFFRASSYGTFRSKIAAINNLPKQSEKRLRPDQSNSTQLFIENNLEPFSIDEDIRVQANKITPWENHYEDVHNDYPVFNHVCNKPEFRDRNSGVSIGSQELKIERIDFTQGYSAIHEQELLFHRAAQYESDLNKIKREITRCTETIRDTGYCQDYGGSEENCFRNELTNKLYNLRNKSFLDIPFGTRSTKISYYGPSGELLSGNNTLNFRK